MASDRLSTIHQHLITRPSVLQSRDSCFQACAATASTGIQKTKAPVINAQPKVALYDEKIYIKLDNFPSNEKITLHAQYIQGRNKIIFASCGHYMSDEFGQVNVTQQPSIGGTYTGLEPMGILWSLQSAPGQPRYARILSKSTDRPMVIVLTSYHGHLQLEDIYQSKFKPESLADIVLERWFRFPSEVARVEVQAGNVRGALYLPHGDGPFQGVIDIYGSSGGIVEFRAALLASRGFAALALPFYNYGDLPSHLSNVTLDYFEEAAVWLSSHPKVFPHGIGVVAVSKGTEFAYCMSAYIQQVKCLAVANGYPYVSMYDLHHKGKCLLKASEFDISRCHMTQEGELIISPGMPYSDNLIPAWQGDAKHLIMASEDDYQVIVDSYKLLTESCPDAKKSNFEVVTYPGAGHLLEPPYSPLCRVAVNPGYQLLMLFGGQMKQHAHAQENSWQRILKHLKQNIPTM